jgi:hypothetical protein
MNKKQYFTIAGFFFILQFFLMFIQSVFFQPSLFIGSELGADAYYQLTKSAITSVIIMLCFPLTILFAILGSLEKKK